MSSKCTYARLKLHTDAEASASGWKKIRPRVLEKHSRPVEQTIFVLIYLNRELGLAFAAAGLMDLNVARGEQVQVIRTAADLEHQSAGLIRDFDIKPVGSSATIVSIHKSADEVNQDILTGGISHFAGAVPVNDVNADLRGSGRDTTAVVNDEVLALEVKAGDVVNNVQVPASGSTTRTQRRGPRLRVIAVSPPRHATGGDAGRLGFSRRRPVVLLWRWNPC